MKKKWAILLWTSCLLGMMACGTQETKEEPVTELAADVWNEIEEPQKENSEIIVSEQLKEIPKFQGELDFAYNSGTDAQSDLGQYSKIAYTEDGYFKIIENDVGEHYIYVYDKNLDLEVPLCSNINCEHNSAECDAFLGEEYLGTSIAYYEDAIYLEKKEDNIIYLEKISKDGTLREKSCEVMKALTFTVVNSDGSTSNSTVTQEIKIHRGYVYYSTYYPGCEEASLCRVKLDSDEKPEILYTLSENAPNIFRIKPYGRYVLFQMGNFDKEGMYFKGKIYGYDTENGEITYFSTDGFREYCIWNNDLYYVNAENYIVKCDLETGEESIFYERTMEDDISLKIFGNEEILVYDMESDEGISVEQYYLNENGEEVGKATGSEMIIPYTN